MSILELDESFVLYLESEAFELISRAKMIVLISLIINGKLNGYPP